MDYISTIRKIARSTKYQNLYGNAEKFGFKLFKNDSDLTDVQTLFLYWCSVYNSLYEDIQMNEPYIDEEIIKDDILTDAYLIYRQRMREKENRKNKKNNQSNEYKDNEKIIRSDLDSIVFV